MWGFEPVVELVDQVEFLVEVERQGIPEKYSGPVDQSITCSLSYDIGRRDGLLMALKYIKRKDIEIMIEINDGINQMYAEEFQNIRTKKQRRANSQYFDGE
tara:strand:+ start:6471 stop:6773 length:303 start_codon:yes stop_codon:yes gene_type:complete